MPWSIDHLLPLPLPDRQHRLLEVERAPKHHLIEGNASLNRQAIEYDMLVSLLENKS